ncbi:MAG: hypothetical protein OEO21_12930 [Candidatus Krumholzibacteria bacterium]|nr:hypothetical protein [Candidatus Krumholzibacteria bacterium]
MTTSMWFQPWQRAGFKLLYLPLKDLDLGAIRFVNLLVIVACSALLYRVAGAFVALVFLTFPLVHQTGARFYSEIPAMLLITASILLLQRQRLAWFALTLSYAVLVRFEIALLFLPAAYVLRKKPSYIPLLFVFPLTFYIVSVAVTGEWTGLFERYTSYTHEHSWKGDDPSHYLRAVFIMGGLWPLLAFPTLIARLRRGDDLVRFMGLSTIALLLLYTLSYWKKTAFGPIIGIERHVLLTAPMIAVFAGTARTPYRAPMMWVAVIIPLVLPLKQKGVEERTLDPACAVIQELTYHKLYVEHGYVNLRLGEPLHSDAITTLEFRKEAQPGDLMLWENHYAARLIGYDEVIMNWMPIWHASTAGFDVYLLRKT